MDMGEIMDKSQYKEQLGKLLTENSQLKEKIKELETELYFKYRNEKVTEHSEKNVNNSVDNIVSTDVELNEDVMEDFYRYHEKIEIPICFYEDDNGERVYDYEAMAEEFEKALSKVTKATVMCSVSEDIVYD